MMYLTKNTPAKKEINSLTSICEISLLKSKRCLLTTKWFIFSLEFSWSWCKNYGVCFINKRQLKYDGIYLTFMIQHCKEKKSLKNEENAFLENLIFFVYWVKWLFCMCKIVSERYLCTVWIYTKSNYGDSRSVKSAFSVFLFANWGALNFVNLVTFSFLKMQRKILKIKIQSLKTC